MPFRTVYRKRPLFGGRTSKSLKAFCYRLKAQFYNLVLIIPYNNSAYRTILFLLIAVRISALLLFVSFAILYHKILLFSMVKSCGDGFYEELFERNSEIFYSTSNIGK